MAQERCDLGGVVFLETHCDPERNHILFGDHLVLFLGLTTS